MTVKEKIMAQGALLWRFLGFFQPPLLRSVHVAVIIGVLLQFLTSMSMEVTVDGPSPLAWIHIIIGMALCLLVLALAVLTVKKRGLRNFFPYLWGDMTQIVKDMHIAAQFKLIAPRPKGVPASIQGLGMCALFMAVFTGLWWFDDWSNDRLGLTALSMHTFFAMAMVVYLIGHGGMALAHFVMWQKKVAPKK